MTDLDPLVTRQIKQLTSLSDIPAGAEIAVQGDAGPVGRLPIDALLAAALAQALGNVGVQAIEDIAAGEFVNVHDSGGSLRVRLAIASDPARFANGYALADIASGATGTVLFSGLNASAVVATAAPEVWLSDSVAGAFSLVPPSAEGSIIQPLGAALPGAGVFFSLRERVLL